MLDGNAVNQGIYVDEFQLNPAKAIQNWYVIAEEQLQRHLSQNELLAPVRDVPNVGSASNRPQLVTYSPAGTSKSKSTAGRGSASILPQKRKRGIVDYKSDDSD